MLDVSDRRLTKREALVRNETRSKSIPSLREHIDTMTTIVERRRKSMSIEPTAGRTLKGCVAVMVWTEADGTETVAVVGDDNISNLELKGVLHDGLYAIAHIDEESWVPSP
jgi:hypothetical protein